MEDGPQFILQMVNSFYVGSSWSWVQIVSPFLSLKGLSDRFILKDMSLKDKSDDKTFFKINFFISQACCVLPAFILVLSIFEYDDQRPIWAKQFSTVRMSQDENVPKIHFN